MLSWINSALKRHNIERIDLHGDSDEKTSDEFNRFMALWRKELEYLCDKKNIIPSCLYNADQTGIFYQKFTKKLYVQKSKNKKYAGMKWMKEKID